MNRVVIHDPETGQWLQFLRPRAVLTAANLTDILPLLTEVDRLLRRDGLYAAGWIGYEAAPAFDPAFRTHPATVFPLACFGIFGPPTILKPLPALTANPPAAIPGNRPSTGTNMRPPSPGSRSHIAVG